MHLPRRLAALFAHPLAPYALALAIQLVFVGYVKDDAYIEYRYATNAAHGHGLVFNVGDPPVEGFTSFLWTVLLVVPALLHVPLLLFGKLAGAASLFGCIALVAALVRRRGGDERTQQIARFITATNASLLVWAQSGMESVETALAVLAMAYLLERRRHLPAMLLAAAAALLRPECHVLLLGAALVVTRRRAPVAALIGLLLVAVVHLWRWRYFGGLVPNTALVKGGDLVWRAGLHLLAELMVTCLAGVTIALSFVEAYRRRDDVALLSVGAIVIFCAYLVRVGRDEMFLVRLFLPVWPLALVLAAPLLARLPSAGVGRLWPLMPLAVCATGIGFTAGRLHTIGYWALGVRSHVVLADLMSAHAQPGDLVVFQDLGQTPWAAMQLRFVDPIGLVDATIARIRWADRASPYLRQPSERGRAAIRDHLFALEPKLVAFVAYVPDELQTEVRQRADSARTQHEKEELFASFVDWNPYHCGMHDDRRFAERYHFVDVVRRKDNYWFVLYERLTPGAEAG